jgi:hypothetical protein
MTCLVGAETKKYRSVGGLVGARGLHPRLKGGH